MDREPNMLDEVETLHVEDAPSEARPRRFSRRRAVTVRGGGEAWLAMADGAEQREALRAGAAGVVSTDAGMEEVEAALGALRHGHAVLPAQLLRELVPASGLGNESPSGPSLTPREASVLELLSEGATNKMIARRLDISVHTAKFHVASILDKLDATTRTDAVAQGVRQGVLML
jgi:DNA-binding NarL/FixJ family response regulator